MTRLLYCFRENQPPFTNLSLVSDGYDRGYVSFAHCLLYFFCQLKVKECMLSTSKLPLGGLPRNSLVWITDCPRHDKLFTVDVKQKIKKTSRTFPVKGS